MLNYFFDLWCCREALASTVRLLENRRVICAQRKRTELSLLPLVMLRQLRAWVGSPASRHYEAAA